jgi:hypothetical protein
LGSLLFLLCPSIRIGLKWIFYLSFKCPNLGTRSDDSVRITTIGLLLRRSSVVESSIHAEFEYEVGIGSVAESSMNDSHHTRTDEFCLVAIIVSTCHIKHLPNIVRRLRRNYVIVQSTSGIVM